MKLMTMLYQMIILNVLFIVFSLPIITIGNSYKALIYCIEELMKGQLEREFKCFFKAFKEDFIKNMLMFLISVVIALVIINNIFTGVTYGRYWFFTILQIPLIIQLLLTMTFLYFVNNHFSLSLLKTFKVSWILGNKHLSKSVVLMASAYALLKLGMYMPFILFFFYFSIYGLIHCVLLSKVIKDLKEAS